MSANQTLRGTTHNHMRGVLFDLDGTLLDTYELLSRSFHHAAMDVFGEDRSMDHFNATIGQPLNDQLWGYTEDEEVHAALCRSYRAYNRTIERDFIKSFPGMADMLHILRDRGWHLGVVTSKKRDSARSNLDIFGMTDLFEFIVGSDDVVRPKPDPEPILAGARRMDLPVEECFYVGDSPYDMVAGNAASAVTVAVHWGQYPIEALRAKNPACECDCVADLPHVLESWR